MSKETKHKKGAVHKTRATLEHRFHHHHHQNKCQAEPKHQQLRVWRLFLALTPNSGRWRWRWCHHHNHHCYTKLTGHVLLVMATKLAAALMIDVQFTPLALPQTPPLNIPRKREREGKESFCKKNKQGDTNTTDGQLQIFLFHKTTAAGAAAAAGVDTQNCHVYLWQSFYCVCVCLSALHSPR